MPKIIVACFIALFVSWGCASSPPPATDPSTGQSAVSETALPDPDLIGHYKEGVDSAAALYDFGDIADFVNTRDSLRWSIEALAVSYPALRDLPEFRQIVTGLNDLDSLFESNGFEHRYLDEIDSLALSFESWPEIDQTQSGTGPAADDDSPIPVLANERIDFWLRYFTGPGKDRFERSIYRMHLYKPTVDDILAELGLHGDLIAVALIESGFNLKARSRARAVGPWQFISGTARIYGLRVTWWYDERRDIIASTYAAGNYLKDLHGIWNDWLLALAAYNCGEYRVARAIARQKTTDFWKLDLPKQTERYVPKFLAALYILQDPDKYGVTIPEVEPVKFDLVRVQDATDLKAIARSADTSVDHLQDLNPSILRWCTPPRTEIDVKVPVGKGTQCAQKLSEIPPEERITWRRHRIRKGETLSQIARAYGTSTAALKDMNGLRSAHRIRAGRSLIVPIQGTHTEVAASSSPPSSKPQYRDKHRSIDRDALEKYAKRYAPPANHKRVVYRVKDGDTLGEIAEVFHTSARRIRGWNNLSYRSYIYPGQKLVIYVPESFDVTGIAIGVPQKPSGDGYVRQTYTVVKGDTFYSISRRFGVGVADLLAWNGKSSRSTIYPGQTLEIWKKTDE
ncbi:MAG: LysM peptidoglycan-binding domain-containing protein [Candidatus Latescibacterota bacterium]|nr:MAG: LysM peptidoglycan-binding domain-containing protein [Candidatus Latescibacterota bacterium]